MDVSKIFPLFGTQKKNTNLVLLFMKENEIVWKDIREANALYIIIKTAKYFVLCNNLLLFIFKKIMSKELNFRWDGHSD